MLVYRATKTPYQNTGHLARASGGIKIEQRCGPLANRTMKRGREGGREGVTGNLSWTVVVCEKPLFFVVFLVGVCTSLLVSGCNLMRFDFKGTVKGRSVKHTIIIHFYIHYSY